MNTVCFVNSTALVLHMGSSLSTGADESLEWIINCLLNSSGLYPKTAEFTKLDNPRCFASLMPFMTFSIKHHIPARWENTTHTTSAFRISGFWSSVFFKCLLLLSGASNVQMCQNSWRNCLNILQSMPTNHSIHKKGTYLILKKYFKFLFFFLN